MILNYILCLDGNLSQVRGYQTNVHNLFNNIIANQSENQMDINLLNAWKTLFEVSHRANVSTNTRASLLIKKFTPLFDANNNNQKYILILCSSIFVLLIINFSICIVLSKRGQGCRKREYNCLNNHKQLTSSN